ncbi:hypothetical protein [Streptomyces sp. NPDC058964]|uniref:hypothetical protein n=1 Tax=Streptomyces sp. NPDC058964 TaxID=3346681 RepID=UPI00367F5ED6
MLICAGWTLRITGMVLGLLGFLVFKSSFESDHWNSIGSTPWWWRLLGAVVAFAAGLTAFLTGRFVVVRGKQHTADIVGSVDRLAGTTYLLYLRPFANDYPDMASLNNDVQGGGANLETLFFISGLTQEEALVRRFQHLGRIVAIGRPGEDLPLPGAARAYLPLNDWQDTVSDLIASAHVVLLSAGPGAGTVWEFTEAVRLLPPTRLLLLAYCDAAAYNLFREAVDEEYTRRSRTEPGAPQTGLWPPLPDLPDYPLPARPQRPRWQVALNGGRKRLRWDFVLKGLVAFGPTWKATFVRFDPTTLPLVSIWTLHRLVKRQLRPITEQLMALNPRN